MNQANIKKRDMAALAEFRNNLRLHPQLLYLFLELTNQCNMHCEHCGSSCLPGQSEHINFDQVIKVLESVRDHYGSSSVMVCLTGGEPMLYPDFQKIVEVIDLMGFPWGITTNGSLITEDMAALLKQNHMGSISISLDGLRESHDTLREMPGSFDKVLQSIKILQEFGMNPQVTTVVNKMNINELDDLYKVLESIHVISWRLINIEPIGRALDHPELMLSRENYRFLLDYIQSKRFNPDVGMEITYGCSHYLPEEYEHMVRDYYFLCGAGINVASILSNGDIFACLDIKRDKSLIQGNIASDDFCDVWENGFSPFREDRSEKCAMCRTCEERLFCAGDCAHTWDYEEEKPLLCLFKVLKGEDTNAPKR